MIKLVSTVGSQLARLVLKNAIEKHFILCAFQDLKNQMEEKLLGVVNSASQQVIEFGDTNGINVNDASLFLELLKVNYNQGGFSL